jgi:hypothetical protein
MLGTGRAMLMSGWLEEPATRQHKQKRHTQVWDLDANKHFAIRSMNG